MATAKPEIQIDAELKVAGITAQLVRFQLTGPADNILHENVDEYWLDLSLTPRPTNARACYRDRWSPHRFERLGKMFVVPPGETFQARSDGDVAQTSMVCRLHAGAVAAVLEDEFRLTDRGLEASLDIQNDVIRSLLLRLAHESRYPGIASDVLVELILSQLVIELGRHLSHIRQAPVSGGLAPWRLRLIDEYLRDGPRSPSLAELASLCQLSVRQLTRGFRASRGCSIGDYIADHRIGRAKSLLAQGQSIKEIAYSLGYGSPSSFCFAFRRSTGVTPRDFGRRTARLEDA